MATIIHEITKHLDHVRKIKIFGSRAKGTHHRYSDVDVAIYLDQPLSDEMALYFLKESLEDKLIYFFDLLIYDDIKNENLRRHIDEIGIVVYEK